MNELSVRDRALLSAAAAGETVAETARRLDRSESRIYHQRGDIARAMGARSWTHAVALAVAAGLISVPAGGEGQ